MSSHLADQNERICLQVPFLEKCNKPYPSVDAKMDRLKKKTLAKGAINHSLHDLQGADTLKA